MGNKKSKHNIVFDGPNQSEPGNYTIQAINYTSLNESREVVLHSTGILYDDDGDVVAMMHTADCPTLTFPIGLRVNGLNTRDGFSNFMVIYLENKEV